MHPQSIFWCSSEPESQSSQHIHLKSASSNRKKTKVIHFHPILCMPAPSVTRSQRESKYESIVQAEESRNVWRQMREKKPPNYKFLGGEAEETGDP
jgi:hypothetical protein